MPVYKCPSCGRSNIDIPNSQASEIDASTLTMPTLQTEVKCKECGWFGPFEELKVGH